MIEHSRISDGELRALIKSKRVLLGGNARLRIYGRLGCPSGRRMRRENRVFFESEAEAVAAGYRPCGICLRDEYRRWKLASGQ